MRSQIPKGEMFVTVTLLFEMFIPFGIDLLYHKNSFSGTKKSLRYKVLKKACRNEASSQTEESLRNNRLSQTVNY
ncbi:MAG: hypothetical protein HUK21_12845 [Fibrobacteraceae bacterium]|nr:hypothetical protein [Fibrobacteraceae bacterium]